MVPILTREPIELLAIDFLSLEKRNGDFEYVLVASRSTPGNSLPVTNKTPLKLLWEKILVSFRFPERLHCDQGRDFKSRLIRNLCKVTRIEKTRTTPYHPQGNAQTERFNRTPLSMPGTLDADKTNDWPEYVLPLVYAYNCTKSLGYRILLLFPHVWSYFTSSD